MLTRTDKAIFVAIAVLAVAFFSTVILGLLP